MHVYIYIHIYTAGFHVYILLGCMYIYRQLPHFFSPTAYVDRSASRVTGQWKQVMEMTRKLWQTSASGSRWWHAALCRARRQSKERQAIAHCLLLRHGKGRMHNDMRSRGGILLPAPSSLTHHPQFRHLRAVARRNWWYPLHEVHAAMRIHESVAETAFIKNGFVCQS